MTLEILTARLKLIPATAARHRMELDAHDALAHELNATIPAAWPPENLRNALDFFAQTLDSRSDMDRWRAWYWLAEIPNNGAQTLIGSGGFKGMPDETGTVEIGYGTLAEFQNRGYATEAVQGLLAWAFRQPGITRVTAEADAENAASVRVLEKCGFVSIGAGSEPNHALFETRKSGFSK